MSARTVSILRRDWPVRGTFRISRSSLSVIPTVQVEVRDADSVGRAECRPYARYEQTVESVTEELELMRSIVEAGAGRGTLQSAMTPGPALNALDCALWDLEAKLSGIPVHEAAGLKAPSPRDTAFTLSVDSPSNMAEAARAAGDFRLLKLKLGASDIVACVDAVAQARPDARLIVDANEAFDADSFADIYDALSPYPIAMIEQPLPAASTAPLPLGDIPICADESLHTAADLLRLRDQGFRAVNVKLDKCGGFTAALALMRQAQAMDLQIMAGCMVGSSLAMAPMVVLAGLADVVDLDGPALLAEDEENGLDYRGGKVFPPSPALWG